MLKPRLVQVETNVMKDGLTQCFACEENEQIRAPSNQIRFMTKLFGQEIWTFSLAGWA